MQEEDVANRKRRLYCLLKNFLYMKVYLA